MDMWKLVMLLLCLSGYCYAGPVGVKRNMPIVQRDDQPMIRQQAGSEEDQPEDQHAPPELISTLTLPSNATSIRADITDSFSCENKTYGYYADVENDCQIFHVCLPVTYADGKENTFRWSFICPEETVFSQDSFTCMRPEDMNFDCEESMKYYELNRNFGAVEEDTNTSNNNNNNNVMTASNEQEQEMTMIAQPEVQQPAVEEPMEVAAAPPKPTLTQPMKETKKPVKVQVPNRRKPAQSQTVVMKKPASTLPLRKLPQVVPSIELTQEEPAAAIEAKPSEEEVKPIYQKYHKRPSTAQATSFKDKIQAQKPLKVTPVRAELYNQVRKRPTYFNKKDTPTKVVEEETAEMSQPELSEPEPTLKLETIFMPIQKPESVAETETHAAETSADNTAQASIAEEVYVKPAEDIETPLNEEEIPSKQATIAEKYEENEALTPEAPETVAENLATVEGVLKTEEPESVEENIASNELLKSSILTAESSNVAETAVIAENIMEPVVEVTETKPVVKFVTPNEAEKLEVAVAPVQEEEREENPVATNVAEKVEDEETAIATDDEEKPAVQFTLEKQDNVSEDQEKPELKLTLPNQEEEIKAEPETSEPEQGNKTTVKSGSPNQVENLEEEKVEEDEEKEKPIVEFTFANQLEEIKEVPKISAPEEVENVAVKFVSTNTNEETETKPESYKPEMEETPVVKYVSSNPTETETQPEISQPEEDETPAVKFVSPNLIENTETQPQTSETEENETPAINFVLSNPAENIETQPETSEPEKQEMPAVKFVLPNQDEKVEAEEETMPAQNTQEAEAVLPEDSVKFTEPETEAETPTDSDDNSQQPIEAIEEIPAVIVEAEQPQLVIPQEQNAIEVMNALKSHQTENLNHESAEALVTPNEPSPVNEISSSLEEMEDAKPANAVETMEATSAMQEHDPIVQTMFANTLKQSIGGFKPVDAAMAAEAEALITDFLSTMMKSENSNNKPIYPSDSQAESAMDDTKAEKNKLESETSIEEENQAKVEAAPEVDEADSQMLKNGAPMSSMLMFNQLPESMYQIPVQVITTPEEVVKSTPEFTEKNEETHKNLDALHVKNVHEEASQAETEQTQPESLTTTAEQEEAQVVPNATPDEQQLKTVADSTVSYTPLSIDDIVELVKERLEQKPAASEVNWAENSEPQVAAESIESDPIVEKLEGFDEYKPNDQQPNEEIILPIYQRVIDVEPNMLKSHHQLLVNEPTPIVIESKPASVASKPAEALGEVAIVDIKQALESPEESVKAASQPEIVVAQEASTQETPEEVPVPSSEFIVDPKTGRFYRSRSLKNTKMDPRKRRFLFRSDAS